MEEKLVLRNVVEGCDEYEIDLSKRIYMFSSLRDYNLSNYIINKLEVLRRVPINFSKDPLDGILDINKIGAKEFEYINGEERFILDRFGKFIRNPEFKVFGGKDIDISLGNSYYMKYLGGGDIGIKYLISGDKIRENAVGDKHIYLRDIDSRKSPYEQMDQVDEIFKLVINNPSCKVFFSTVSPYVVNYFNVNLLKYYEELGDKFSYYQINEEMDDKTGKFTIWNLNAICNKSGRKFASTLDFSDIMELIYDEYRYEREKYNERNNIEKNEQ